MDICPIYLQQPYLFLEIASVFCFGSIPSSFSIHSPQGKLIAQLRSGLCDQAQSAHHILSPQWLVHRNAMRSNDKNKKQSDLCWKYCHITRHLLLGTWTKRNVRSGATGVSTLPPHGACESCKPNRKRKTKWWKCLSFEVRNAKTCEASALDLLFK